jgi:hypothetical protein
MNLGMRLAGAFVRPVADDDTFSRHHAGADDRVRRRAAETAPCVLERAPHPAGVVIPRGVGGQVVYHFSWNKASTYSSAENGIKSSIPSPTPT